MCSRRTLHGQCLLGGREREDTSAVTGHEARKQPSLAGCQILPDGGRNSFGDLRALFGVQFGRLHLTMPENMLRGLNTKPSADCRRCRMPQSMRMPLIYTGALAS